MRTPTTLNEINHLFIEGRIQENIHLDYKASPALSLNKRDEIAKDVSAFANSDGGLIIYGVKEKDNFPAGIDEGVDDKIIDREWIESVPLFLIRPRIESIRIYPIRLVEGRSLYVIDVPKSFRGPHQSADKKYYKRHNFSAEPMHDYEITDVRSRSFEVSPAVVFRVEDYKDVLIAFHVENVTSRTVKNLTFVLPDGLPWPSDRPTPEQLLKGIPALAPGQALRFLWFHFSQVLAQGSTIPSDFEIEIAYVHPITGTVIRDVWPVNIESYRNSVPVRTSLEDQVANVVEDLKLLADQFNRYIRLLERREARQADVGVKLSAGTLANLKRILIDRENPHPLRGRHQSREVFSERLGVDSAMGYALADAFRNPELKWDDLRAIPGMTDDLLTKVQAAFDRFDQ